MKMKFFPLFRDEGEVVAAWGETQLIRYLDGKTELRGGSKEDRLARLLHRDCARTQRSGDVRGSAGVGFAACVRAREAGARSNAKVGWNRDGLSRSHQRGAGRIINSRLLRPEVNSTENTVARS